MDAADPRVTVPVLIELGPVMVLADGKVVEPLKVRPPVPEIKLLMVVVPAVPVVIKMPSLLPRASVPLVTVLLGFAVAATREPTLRLRVKPACWTVTGINPENNTAATVL